MTYFYATLIAFGIMAFTGCTTTQLHPDPQSIADRPLYQNHVNHHEK